MPTKRRTLAFYLAAVLAGVPAVHGQSLAPKRIDLSKLVVLGDSLPAGFQNFSLWITQQEHGFPSVIANQAGVPLILPRIPYPGIPAALHIASLSPLVIQPYNAPLPSPPRENMDQFVTNLAVPGVFLDDVLNKRPGGTASAVDLLTNIVLGIPAGPPRSQVETAVAMRPKPTTILVWAGSNDALMAMLSGDFSQITPVTNFVRSYAALLDALTGTGATVICANLPDSTIAPYFTKIQDLATQTGKTVTQVSAMLGVGALDTLRPGALPRANDILAGRAQGPLPSMCPANIPGLPIPEAPCVFTFAQATYIRANLLAFNAAITSLALLRNVPVVDSFSLISRINSQGYVAHGLSLNTGFLGGLITLDGIHPTNTLHAIIANEFIRVINNRFNSNIAPVSVDAVAAADPLVIPAVLKPAK